MQTVKYPILDPDGFQIGERVAHVFRDPDTQTDWEQHSIKGKKILVPAGTYEGLESRDRYLFDNPNTWRQYKSTFGQLPQWYESYFKSGRSTEKEDEPTPGPGQTIAARGQVQRDGAGGGGGTAPAPDLKERLLTRASEMQ